MRKRNVVFAVLGFVLATAAGALAAWIIMSGAHGSTTSHVGTAQTIDAVTIAPADNGLSVIPGTPINIAGMVTNDASTQEKVTSLTTTSITASPTCDTSALTFTEDPGFASLGLIPGDNGQKTLGTLTAGANLDPACAGSTLTLNFSGQTTP